MGRYFRIAIIQGNIKTYCKFIFYHKEFENLFSNRPKLAFPGWMNESVESTVPRAPGAGAGRPGRRGAAGGGEGLRGARGPESATSLPDSLKDAIRTFIVARAIRLARNQVNEHNSMLVNASRFTRIQGQMRNEIHIFLNNIIANLLPKKVTS